MIRSHEAIVHFPIALFITAFVFGLIGIFYKRELFKEIIFWNTIIGLLACSAAIYTGILDQEQISDQHLQETLEMHKRNAYFCGIMLAGLTVWMGWRKKLMDRLEYIAWMSIFFVATTSIGYQGYIGHDMTFKQMEKTMEMSIEGRKQKPSQADFGWTF